MLGFSKKFLMIFSFISDIEPSFSSRNVTVKKGVDAKEFYDLVTEIGR